MLRGAVTTARLRERITCLIALGFEGSECYTKGPADAIDNAASRDDHALLIFVINPCTLCERLVDYRCR